MYENLVAQLQGNEIVLTPNRRLSRFLQNEYQEYQRKQQKTVWLTPTILPFTSWLEQLWEELLVRGYSQPLLRLASYQELVIWQQIINQSITGSKLLQITTTTYLAQQAWELCKQWQIDFRQTIFTYTEETSTWQQWAQRFSQLCTEKNWLDSASLATQLTALIVNTHHEIAKKIFLIGFEEICPQYQYLLKILEDQGCCIQCINLTIPQPAVARISLADETQEINTMAQWAYNLWQQNKDQTITCIVPNLVSIRDKVLQAFTELFAPINLLPGHLSDELPFNISMGPKLNEYPIILDALTLLKLDRDNDFRLISYLLRSPYLGFAEQEMTKRALLDSMLGELGELKITLHQLQVYAKQAECSHLAYSLQELRKILEKEDPEKKMSASMWAKYYAQRLKSLGWPGESVLSSQEYQLCQAWQEALSTFASLDALDFSWKKTQAISMLVSLVSQTAFQAKSPATTINILGTLEAGGLLFDNIWLMGLAKHAWPPPAQPNPFIPIKLQRQANLPHASNERELKFCQTLTQRLTHSAQHVIISHPLIIDDQPAHPSALIVSFPIINIEKLNLPSSPIYSQWIYAHTALETFEDSQAEALPQNTLLHGGSALFKHQAACPFRAFSYFRLRAKSLKTPSLGLSYAERGLLLHTALESVWNLLQHSQHLQLCSENELQEIIRRAITQAFVPFIKKRPRTFHERFVNLEKNRLQKILLDWLRLEKQRSDFIVIALEKNQTINFNGIRAKLRIDRIDELSKQNYLIIDYKTSNNFGIQDWLGTRLDEPQLPLYCITSELPIQGIAFAQLTASSLKFSGISAQETHIPGIIPINKLEKLNSATHWTDLIQNWQATLTKLSTEFMNGYARVEPKEGEKTCRYCDLRTLCRIDEANKI